MAPVGDGALFDVGSPGIDTGPGALGCGSCSGVTCGTLWGVGGRAFSAKVVADGADESGLLDSTCPSCDVFYGLHAVGDVIGHLIETEGDLVDARDVHGMGLMELLAEPLDHGR